MQEPLEPRKDPTTNPDQPEPCAYTKGEIVTSYYARGQLHRVSLGDEIQGYELDKFLEKGGFFNVARGTAPNGDVRAFVFCHVDGGGRFVRRFLEPTDSRSADGISPDEHPTEAVFIDEESVVIDLIDTHDLPAVLDAQHMRCLGFNHDLFVRSYDYIEVDGLPVQVTECVEGQSLRERFRLFAQHDGSREQLITETAEILYDIVHALLYERKSPSKKDQYHGDLKPESIRVVFHSDGREEVRVSFPSVSVAISEKRVTTKTPSYDPFYYQGVNGVKADIFSVGVMLYEAATGECPFEDVPYKFAAREQGGQIEALTEQFFLSYQPLGRKIDYRERTLRDYIAPKIDERLRRVINNCLQGTRGHEATYTLEQLEKDLRPFQRQEPWDLVGI